MPDFRTMNTGDIPAGLALCRSAGWNQLAGDWQLFLEASPQNCRVATDETGKVIGTVTTIKYEDHFSWIGMVLVDPSKKNQGIGTALLNEALHILRDQQTIKLDATPAGRKIYLKLDFADEYTLMRMYTGQISVQDQPGSIARQMRQDDFPAILEFDRKIFGAVRKVVLEHMFVTAPEYAWVLEENNTINGYCFGRNGFQYAQIGPIVANDTNGAITLVAAALKNRNGQPFIIDIKETPDDFLHWLTSIGFSEQRRLIRMYRGSNTWPGMPEKQFAILGPEFG